MSFTAQAVPDGSGWKITGSIDTPQPAAPPLSALAAWLRAIEPEELERVALARCEGLGAGSVTADILDVLATWAEGSP